MRILSIKLLGDFRLTYDDEAITSVNTPRLQALFAYLLLHRQAPQSRQQIAFQFWPDSSEKQAHTNLRKLLFQLRNALPSPDAFLTQDHLTVQWRPDAPYILDVAELQTTLARCLTADGKPIAQAPPDALLQATSLYQGSLLPSCFDEWLLPLRQQLEHDVIRVFEQLIHLAEHQREYQAGIRYAQRLLGIDRLHEVGYRRLIQFQALNGDRTAALHTYQTCSALLQQELGVEPDDETQALYRHVLQQESQSNSSPLQRVEAPSAVLRQQRIPLVAWLPFTKFQPPAARLDLVARTRLLAQLQWAVFNHRLTLLSAPAGSGKTTLLTQLVAAARTDQLAWLRFDQHDDQPTVFLVALIRALTTLVPGFGSNLLAWIATAEQFSTLTTVNAIRPAIGLLINEIVQTLSKPFALVLDDCHRLEHPVIFAGLDYLLDHMPAQMRLIIATRHDPPLALDRLRGQGSLAEFRFAQLAFDAQEAAIFLNGQQAAPLSSHEIQTAFQQTQGWPAGLRLLVNAFLPAQKHSEHSSTLTSFTQSHTTSPIMSSYLLNEVLNHQPADVRNFLLQTALLAELTPSLCRALTGRTDTADVLIQLYGANLFVTQVTPGQGTSNDQLVYRYHDLFADFLRQRLQIEMPDQIAALHQRAALAETVLERKLAHFFAGESWEPAAQLLNDVGDQLVQEGLVDTLYGWLTQLPSALRQAHPQLLYLYGICQWQKQAWDAALATLLQALQAFETTGNRKGEGNVLVHLASCAMFTNNFGAALQWIASALDLPIHATSKVQVLLARLWIRYNQPTPDWEQVEQDFSAAVQVTQQSPDRATLRTFAVLSGAALLWLPGGLAGIEQIIALAWQQTPLPDPFWQMVLISLRAWSDWVSGEPEAAQLAIERCLTLGETFAYTFHGALHDLCLLRVEILSAKAQYTVAHSILANQIQSARAIPLLEGSLIAFYLIQCRLYWQQGAFAEARAVYQLAEEQYGERVSPTMRACLPIMRCLLALSDKDYVEAESHLQQALSMERDCCSATLVAQPRVLYAYLYWQWKGEQAALNLFGPVLAEYKRANTPGWLTFAGGCVVPLLKLAIQYNLHAEFALRVLQMLGQANP